MQVHNLQGTCVDDFGRTRSCPLANLNIPGHRLEPGIDLIAEMPKLQSLRLDVGGRESVEYSNHINFNDQNNLDELITLRNSQKTICEALPCHPTLRKLVLRGRVVPQSDDDVGYDYEWDEVPWVVVEVSSVGWRCKEGQSAESGE